MLEFDHVGYAVNNLEKSRKSFEALGYVFCENIHDDERNINLAFGKLGGFCVELVAPDAESSPVNTYLQKIGVCPYHVCYKSSDINQDMNFLVSKRYKITLPLAPAIAFGGRRVVFMYALNGGLIELVETRTS